MKTVSGPHVNPFHETFTTKNSSRKHFSSGNKSDLRVRKETINMLLIGLICLKKLSSWQKKNLFIENSNEARNVLGDSRESYRDRG